MTRLLGDYFDLTQEQVFLFGAARMSVYSLLKSLGLKPTDEVIVAGYTCVVLTNAVKFAGCAIKYVDIETHNFNPSIDSLLQGIGPDTKVIIVPHNFGLPTNDISRLKAENPRLVIIEDVAHSFGSITSSGKRCGTVGDAAFFSLEYSKPITSGLGGIMLINNPDLLEAFKKDYSQLGYAGSAMTWKIILTLGALNLWYFKSISFFQSAAIRLLSILGLRYATSKKEIEGEMPDNYPVKLSPKLVCFLLPQLKQLEKINAEKKAIAGFYKSELDKFEDIESIEINDTVLIRYPILFKPSVSLETVNAIKREAAKRGYVFGEWFNDVVHPRGSYRYGYRSGDCPNGEFVAARIANLPVNVNNKIGYAEMKEIGEIFKSHGLK
ncbi:MAG TPA: DegT/DnrJ/EryC1/StrS family aminotransferase [Cryomorphaceae bacterium]|nr:DegT/DnrJ/EryC1/StrS family aminotransferase [Cryomorphaceae bacterium]